MGAFPTPFFFFFLFVLKGGHLDWPITDIFRTYWGALPPIKAPSLDPQLQKKKNKQTKKKKTKCAPVWPTFFNLCARELNFEQTI
jgi:hypothetical protein